MAERKKKYIKIDKGAKHPACVTPGVKLDDTIRKKKRR